MERRDDAIDILWAIASKNDHDRCEDRVAAIRELRLMGELAVTELAVLLDK